VNSTNIIHAVVALAIVGASSALLAVGKLTGADVLPLYGAVLGWAINQAGVTSGAQAATPTPSPTAAGTVQSGS
jgi:proteasome assembly chaperone (PAC2) family protein